MTEETAEKCVERIDQFAKAMAGLMHHHGVRVPDLLSSNFLTYTGRTREWNNNIQRSDIQKHWQKIHDANVDCKKRDFLRDLMTIMKKHQVKQQPSGTFTATSGSPYYWEMPPSEAIDACNRSI